jgi:hypothetical protein
MSLPLPLWEGAGGRGADTSEITTVHALPVTLFRKGGIYRPAPT